MSTPHDGGVHETQQPQRSPGFVEGGFGKRGCLGAVVGGLCGAVSSLLTFPIALFVCAKVDPNFWWAVVGIVYAPIFGAGVCSAPLK
jgi:hypothetical protein